MTGKRIGICKNNKISRKGSAETGFAKTKVSREPESRTGAIGMGREVDGGIDEEYGTMTESTKSSK